jgi:DICT domain-containing protein/predicted DNA-binding transcriptional regulator AlpA
VSAPAVLSIREVADRTGLTQATVRMWEQRYGLPRPHRLPSGHRRYSEDDIAAIRAVEAQRRAGVSLRAAVHRVRERVSQPEPSIFAGLRRRHPGLDPFLLPKRALIGMSEAIEDECAVRSDRAVMVASFQREHHYRAAQSRWRNLAERAELALVFADFTTVREPPGAPVEVPIPSSEPLAREWALVCEAVDFSACLSAWEPPGQDERPDLERRFETVWSVEAPVVRNALELALATAARRAPEVVGRVPERLERPVSAAGDEVRLATALTSRIVAYISGDRPGRLRSRAGREEA